MILGLSLDTFTRVHVVISLVGIVAGFVAVGAMIRSQRADGATTLFLNATLLTSITGFMFPSSGSLTPAQILGYISIAVLAGLIPRSTCSICAVRGAGSMPPAQFLRSISIRSLPLCRRSRKFRSSVHSRPHNRSRHSRSHKARCSSL